MRRRCHFSFQEAEKTQELTALPRLQPMVQMTKKGSRVSKGISAPIRK